MIMHLRIKIIILRFHRVVKILAWFNVRETRRAFRFIKLSSMKPQNNDFNSYIYILYYQ